MIRVSDRSAAGTWFHFVKIRSGMVKRGPSEYIPSRMPEAPAR